MKITIKNHLNDLQVSAAKMLLYHSDNRMLITYFKDLSEKLVYLEKLTEEDTRFDFIEIQNAMDEIYKRDNELTHIQINLQIKPVTKEKKEGIINGKMFKI
jgi:hypothetical protein